MTETLHGLVRDEGRQQFQRKNAGDFEEMREKLLANAYELKEISEHEIPEAFPLSPPKGGIDYNYNHSDFEMMFIDSQTDIDDGTAAIEVVQREVVKFEALKLVLASLFPTKTSNGVYDLQINDQFESSMKIVDEAVGMLSHILKSLNQSLGQYPSNSINSQEMKKLKNHLTRIGVEFYKSGEIPFDLRNKGGGILSPERISRERENIESAAMQIAARNITLASPKRGRDGDAVRKAFSAINFSEIFQPRAAARDGNELS